MKSIFLEALPFINRKIRKHKDYLFLSNSAYFFLNTIVVSALSGLFWWAAARFYPSDSVGLVVVLLSAAQLLTTVAQFGLGYGIIRYLPAVEENRTSFINFAFTFVIAFSLLLAVFGVLFGPLLYKSQGLPSLDAEIILPFIFFVVSLALFQLFYQILAAARSAKTLLVTNALTSLGRLGILVAGVFVPGEWSLIYAFTIPTVAAVLILFFLVLPNLIPGYRFAFNFDAQSWTTVLKYSASSFLGNFIHDIPYQLIPQIVGIFLGLTVAAVFYINWQIYGLLITLGTSLSLSLFVEGSHNSDRVASYVKKSLITSLIVTLAGGAIVVLTAAPILQIFGKTYALEGIPQLRVLAVAAVINAGVYSLIAEQRVKMRTGVISLAYLIIAVVTIGLIVLQGPGNLVKIGVSWLIGQAAAAVFLLVARLTDRKSDNSFAQNISTSPGSLVVIHPMDSHHPAQGGGIRYLMNIVRYFGEKKWQIAVVGCADEPEVQDSAWRQISVSRDTRNWVKYLFNLFFKLPWIALPGSAVILAHRVDCMLAAVLFKPANPKVLVSAVPGYYLRVNHPQLYRLFGWLYLMAERLCVRGVDYIVPVDEATRMYYLRIHPRAKVSECIPSSVDLSKTILIEKDEAREKVGWPKDAPCILFVGRLSKVKDIPFLIRSFAQVEKTLPEARLYIAGDGEERDAIRLLAGQTSPRITLLGAIAPDQIAFYYAAADVLALCSVEEGSPTVVKEALACGLPVVSTDVGDVREILSTNRDFGILVHIKKEEIYSSHLSSWLFESKGNRLIKASRRMYSEQFSTECVGKKFQTIFGILGSR